MILASSVSRTRKICKSDMVHDLIPIKSEYSHIPLWCVRPDMTNLNTENIINVKIYACRVQITSCPMRKGQKVIIF